MRVLIIHSSRKYFGGAEQLLGYFLSELARTGVQISVATAGGPRVEALIPAWVERIPLPDNEEFGLGRLASQLCRILHAHRATPVDVVHGWSARDWELTTLSAKWLHRPGLGTLHDHPHAAFITWKRQRLMRWSARWGLQRVICISEAVRRAAEAAGYPRDRLAMIHNGVPVPSELRSRTVRPPVQLGFLGVFSERKGVRSLFAILEQLERMSPGAWEMNLAGEPQDAVAERFLAEIKQRYAATEWWNRVHWRGWVSDPMEFLKEVDILICPSAEFEPFGLVLCEAALAGSPVVAACVGAIPEIVRNGQTGWLYDPGDPAGAAGFIARLISEPQRIVAVGREAFTWVAREFSLAKMVAGYTKVYAELAV